MIGGSNDLVVNLFEALKLPKKKLSARLPSQMEL